MFYKCFYFKILCLIQLSSLSLFVKLASNFWAKLFLISFQQKCSRLFWRYRSPKIKTYTNCLTLLWFQTCVTLFCKRKKKVWILLGSKQHWMTSTLIVWREKNIFQNIYFFAAQNKVIQVQNDIRGSKQTQIFGWTTPLTNESIITCHVTVLQIINTYFEIC